MSESPSPPTPPSPPQAPPGGSHSFGERLLGALRLDATMYAEIEHDEEALPQAAGVVALAAVCGGIAGLGGGVSGLIGGVIAAVVLWLLGAGIVWLVGVRMMNHTSDYPELLRTLGFAQAPQLLMIVGIIPVLGAIVGLVVLFWGLAAYVVAVREALDVDTGRAVLVCVLAWAVWFVVAMFTGVLGLAG